MNKIIIACAVLTSILATPAIADSSQGDGARLPLAESPSHPAVGHRYLTAAARHDVEKCEGYVSGDDDIYPFECVVGTHNNGSDGGSDSDSGSSSSN